MARAPNEKISEAFQLFQKGEKLVSIAKKLGVPEGTVRRWKSTYRWSDSNGERSNQNSERSDKNKKRASARKEVLDPLELVIKDFNENVTMNEKQKLFCIHYVKSFNATKSYMKVYGCDYWVAAANASRLLKDAKITDEIHRLKLAKLNQAMLEPSDIFQKYMDIAFSDITDFLHFGRELVPVMGPFGPITGVNEDGKKEVIMKEVNVVKFHESDYVDGTLISEVKQGKDGASIKLADRMKALDWLAQHMNMATEEQKMRMELMRLKATAQGEGPEEYEDDGFIAALGGKAAEVWKDVTEDGQDEA